MFGNFLGYFLILIFNIILLCSENMLCRILKHLKCVENNYVAQNTICLLQWFLIDLDRCVFCFGVALLLDESSRLPAFMSAESLLIFY